MGIISRVYILIFYVLQIIIINKMLEFKFHIRKKRLLRNKLSKIFRLILIYMAIIVINIVIYLSLYNIGGLVTDKLELFSSMIGTILVIIIIQLYKIYENKKLGINVNKGILFILCFALFLDLFISIYPITISDSKNTNYKFIICVSFNLLILWGIILLLYYININSEYQRQVQLEKEKGKLLENYYNSIIKNDLEIKKFIHDYKNHIRSLKYLIREHKYEKLNKYISDMDNLSPFGLQNVDVGDEFVSAVLSEYVSKSKKNEIEMTVSGTIPETLNIADIDWSVILSNCIDNAFEAALKVKEEKREIQIRFSSINNRLVIEICNSIVTVPVIKEGQIQTTKQDIKSHGFGINNVRKCIEKYHGNISYEISENKKKIIVKIVLIL